MPDTEPILYRPPREWFHGSPLRLEFVQEGSTVTPIIELARVFAHKPARVELNTEEHGITRTTTITHNGQFDGYLYRVLVENPEADLRQHPTSAFAPGEEMLVTRDIALEFLGELPMSAEPEMYLVMDEITADSSASSA